MKKIFTLLFLLSLPVLAVDIVVYTAGERGSWVGSGTAYVWVRSSLVLEYLFTDTMTNASGLVVDTSTYGNNGTPGAAGALPTYVLATNTMSAYVSADGGDSITSVVSEVQVAYSFYANTNSAVWRYYLWTNAVTYVDGVAEAFTLSDFIDTNDGVTMTWLSGYTGLMDEMRMWTNAVAPSNFPASNTNHGWDTWDYANRSDWSNAYVFPFRYASAADHGGYTEVRMSANFGGGANLPSFGSDTTNSWIYGDGNDTISRTNWIDLSAQTGITIMGWVYQTANSDIAGFGIGGQNSGKAVCRYNAGNDKWRATMGTPDNVEYRTKTSSATVTNDIWYHLCGVFQNGAVALYVNGITQPTATQVGTATFAEMSGVGANTIRILCSNNSTVNDGTDAWFTGRQNDIRIYPNRLLPSNEVFAIYSYQLSRHP